MISFSRRLLRNGKSLNNERAGFSHAQDAFIRTQRSGARRGWGKGWGRWKARTTLNTSYSLRVDEPLQRAPCNPRVRVCTCESRGMKIYHTVFITVDAIVGSNYVWREVLDFPRAATIYASTKDRRVASRWWSKIRIKIDSRALDVEMKPPSMKKKDY
jgi:hypothetical protein